MPQWAGSCWYYLRFIDPGNHTRLVDLDKENYWMPVDLYLGGPEHAGPTGPVLAQVDSVVGVGPAMLARLKESAVLRR